MPLPRARFFAALCLATLVALPALAQSTAREREDEKKAEAQAEQAEHQAAKEEEAKAPPPAIPGASANPDAMIPSDRSAADLAPNDALFDAITRDDVGAARDAMNRGAQLDAHNQLGQTPLDAAIDLDRNDITFLLLSLRGSEGPAARRPVSGAAQSASAAPKSGARLPAKPGRVIASAQTGGGKSAAALADGGTPVPQAGFLGF